MGAVLLQTDIHPREESLLNVDALLAQVLKYVAFYQAIRNGRITSTLLEPTIQKPKIVMEQEISKEYAIKIR